MDTWLRPARICRGPCGRTLPLTTEHWYRRTRSVDGFQARCRDCTRADLDAADARAKARRRWGRYMRDWEDLERFIATQASEVAHALYDAAESGTPAFGDYLAARLEHPCPFDDDLGDLSDEDDDRPLCWLCYLGRRHTVRLQEQLPEPDAIAEAAMDAAIEGRYADAAEDEAPLCAGG